MVDYDALINPPKQMPPRLVGIVDRLSWFLPAVAALLSAWGGLEALQKADGLAAWLGIGAGVVGALGVVFTNLSSRVRDDQLKMALSSSALGIDMAGQALSHHPGAL